MFELFRGGKYNSESGEANERQRRQCEASNTLYTPFRSPAKDRAATQKSRESHCSRNKENMMYNLHTASEENCSSSCMQRPPDSLRPKQKEGRKE
ncbi:hypothetical protein ACROYT_G014303 [Oculina patagonica]